MSDLSDLSDLVREELDLSTPLIIQGHVNPALFVQQVLHPRGITPCILGSLSALSKEVKSYQAQGIRHPFLAQLANPVAILLRYAGPPFISSEEERLVRLAFIERTLLGQDIKGYPLIGLTMDGNYWLDKPVNILRLELEREVGVLSKRFSKGV